MTIMTMMVMVSLTVLLASAVVVLLVEAADAAAAAAAAGDDDVVDVDHSSSNVAHNNDNDDNDTQIVYTMTAVLGTMIAILVGLIMIQTPVINDNKMKKKNDDNKTSSSSSSSTFLPNPITQPSKYAYEMFVMSYTPIWIVAFGIIVVFQLYEQFDEWSYWKVCGGLALPFLLQPIVLPSAGYGSPDSQRPLLQRYAFKANAWLAVYSFIGNYWYTHYFYSVLKAQYTMPSHRLNNVPIAMYCATHFYFSTYHFFSNCLLRKVVTSYQSNYKRTMLFVGVVIVFSYFTAFMETLTISSYPYYSFEDKYMAYTIGSAFYGIYFLVSFPGFYNFDNDIDNVKEGKQVVSIWDTIVSSCGHGMMILTLLDFVRLYLGIPLIIKG